MRGAGLGGSGTAAGGAISFAADGLKVPASPVAGVTVRRGGAGVERAPEGDGVRVISGDATARATARAAPPTTPLRSQRRYEG
jgi:hypothetical protein